MSIFYVINLRQTQKDVETDIVKYVDMKLLAQVNRIKNLSEKEIEEAKNKGRKSDFVYCMLPTYKGKKLCAFEEHICIISVLGDTGTVFFDNGFSIGDEKQRLHLWRDLSIKDGSCNREGRSEIFCYTPQLCDRTEKADTHNNKPFFYLSLRWIRNHLVKVATQLISWVVTLRKSLTQEIWYETSPK